MTNETQESNIESVFETFKVKFTVSRPESIREKVAEWAFEEAATIGDVITCLERMACAACYSPAPIYNHDMAAAIVVHWLEIDEAMDAYLEATGEQWTPQKHGSLLSYLWFAYEWTASELANEIRSELDTMED